MKKLFCPIDDFTCPYYKRGKCELENPAEDCDDYAAFNYEEEDE